MPRRLFFAVFLAVFAFAQKKYMGPRPPKPDVPYLLHASNLIETEVSDAKEERLKDGLANIISGTSSPARTPLAEPIFIMIADRIQPDRLELYKMSTKGGQREAVIPGVSKKSRGGQKALRLSVTRLEQNLYKVEANQWLDNGEYCMSPQGSQQVFCFSVY